VIVGSILIDLVEEELLKPFSRYQFVLACGCKGNFVMSVNQVLCLRSIVFVVICMLNLLQLQKSDCNWSEC
jgi:hypothetical protein